MIVIYALRDPVLAMCYRYDHGKCVYTLNIFRSYIFFRPLEEIRISAYTAC